MIRSRLRLAALISLVAAGCSDDDHTGDADIADTTISDTDSADTVDAADTDPADTSGEDGDDGDAEDGSGSDADTDTGAPAWPETPTMRAYAAPPGSSLVPEELDSCAIVGETACAGTTRECAIWDSEAGDWAEDVPRMALQAFWYDRYFDLYHDFEGLALDIDLSRAIPPGTPESEWSDPDNFESMNAYGDASGWTGTGLFGAAARYQSTGTSADYDRMLEKFDSMMFLYEVTNIPGMIARSHFALLPEGAPRAHGHWGESISTWYNGDGSGWHFRYPIEEPLLDRVPDYYDDGVTIHDVFYDTEPQWQGDASRDMYVRSMPGVLLAYDMLGEGEREDRLREVVEAELPCTLNRMKYGRIENLQSRPDLLEAVTAFLGSAGLETDPGDADFTTLDTLIVFAMEQPNPAHWDLFDRECPDGPPLEPDPEYMLDAESPTFLLDMLELFGRIGRTADAPIAWVQAPSVRAADLVYMLQWALVAHYLTDDARYLEFVDMLTEETEFAGVLRTWGAYQLPKWCRSHFAPSLSYPSLYNLLARIDPETSPDTWQLLSEVATTEGREKELANAGDAYWGVLYNRMWSEEFDDDAEAYIAEHVELLRGYGIDPENPLEPDRNRAIDWVDPPYEGLEFEYPTEDDIAVCETPINVLGIEIPAPGMSDEGPRSVDALPLWMRDNGGFLWTGDPWRVQRTRGTDYTVQYPMLGMTVPYWVGRADGVIDDGGSLALAWRDTEEACGE